MRSPFDKLRVTELELVLMLSLSKHEVEREKR
jgi:hypothetical protein